MNNQLHSFPAGIDRDGLPHESSQNMSPLDFLLRSNDLSPEELTQLYRTVGTLQAHANDPRESGDSEATTGVLGLLKNTSPKVQKVIGDLMTIMDGEHESMMKPFDSVSRMTPQQHAEQLFDNPEQALKIHGALNNELLTSELLKRRGGIQRESMANDTSGRRKAIEDAMGLLGATGDLS